MLCGGSLAAVIDIPTCAHASQSAAQAVQPTELGPPVSTFPRSPAYVRRNLGRPGAEPDKMERARQELAKGTGIGKTARLTGLGTGTVQRLKREMAIVQ
jgi:hypothetical protein